MPEKIDSDAFLSQRSFYDDTNFPYGFLRSGDFSIAEANVLTSHGYIMSKLHKGEIAPTTPEHKRFIQVVNRTIDAKYVEENIYLKYLHVIKNKNRYITALTKVKAKNYFTEEENKLDYEL